MSVADPAPLRQDLSGPRFDQPVVEDESQPYWDAANEGRLLLKRCSACGAYHHYPRPFCPSCWSEDVAWVDAAGTGTVYAYSTVYVNDLAPFGPEVPYVAAVVELDEGPRMMTRLVDCTGDDVEIGAAVTVAFQQFDGDQRMPVFRLA